jgi:hypothetical protein
MNPRGKSNYNYIIVDFMLVNLGKRDLMDPSWSSLNVIRINVVSGGNSTECRAQNMYQPGVGGESGSGGVAAEG